ncbi:hypothetical protein Zmor_010626 [Zophobas morio]|uniref:FYVE-type domain-containing protein n=1 Tax=Zophobas morio TaxID=2755281 RepID=A0AA38MK36_9CUCU|nr:hypothetical protein Zmor_010626 [Zophobas morio]
MASSTMDPMPVRDNLNYFKVLVSPKVVHLLDEQRNVLIKTEQEFVDLLKINPRHKIKVVSIVGNTGNGKSYTLNHTFFDGVEFFKTKLEYSCNLGMWAKYDPTLKIICIDTEGFVASSKEICQQSYFLLKIFAISDIVIYRTTSEELPSYMYRFLGEASKIYKEYFNCVLQKIWPNYETEKETTSVGPCVIIFNEPKHPNTLTNVGNITATVLKQILRENFARHYERCDGFSSLHYVRALRSSKEYFKELRWVVEKELKSIELRSPRSAKYVYHTLKEVFNEKLRSQRDNSVLQQNISSYFTCRDKCQSCGTSCSLPMNHQHDDEPHFSERSCKFQHQYQNFVYFCKKCCKNGRKQIVKPSKLEKNEQSWSNIVSTAWSGYTIECPRCGKIYQSRSYWFGNKAPEDEAVVVETQHAWQGHKSLWDPQISGQNAVDVVTTIGNIVTNVGSEPKKMIGDWLTDKIAPSYWKPNSEILKCAKCETVFGCDTTKHHCRVCGKGFCQACSSKTQPVPEKGWYEDVRVCDFCYIEYPLDGDFIIDGTEVRRRRIGESVIDSVSRVKSIFDKPKELIKNMARPAYWIPDKDCKNCVLCDKPFGPLLLLHHCRDCGKGVCDGCSSTRKPVPHRGWEMPVRICDKCSPNDQN